MHYHVEVIMPDMDNIPAGIDTLMAPFSEHGTDKELIEKEGYDPFASYQKIWDYFVIGGRWSGEKAMKLHDPEKISNFREKLVEMKITVSSIMCGKQDLEPPTQQDTVDALWREWFPDSPFTKCPLFQHAFGPKFNHNPAVAPGDIMKVKDLTELHTAAYVIIGGPGYDCPLEPKHLFAEDFWTGCNWQKTDWDGSVMGAIRKYNESLKVYNEETQEKKRINSDWLVTTVDIHR